MNQSRSIPPTITCVQGTKKEEQTKAQLLRLFEQYPLDKWRYTEHIRIQEGTIPHSHPVLTLHTRHLGDDEELLGTYLHEQLHWFCLLADKAEFTMHAIGEFAKTYPDLPLQHPEGCGTSFDNSLHILVNTLEYLALNELLGSEETRKTLERKTYYTSIYALVLKEHERICEVIGRYGLFPPAYPPEGKAFVEVG